MAALRHDRDAVLVLQVEGRGHSKMMRNDSGNCCLPRGSWKQFNELQNAAGVKTKQLY